MKLTLFWQNLEQYESTILSWDLSFVPYFFPSFLFFSFFPFFSPFLFSLSFFPSFFHSFLFFSPSFTSLLVFLTSFYFTFFRSCSWIIYHKFCGYVCFLLSPLLRNCFLCEDHWNSDVTPTLDKVLLCSDIYYSTVT